MAISFSRPFAVLELKLGMEIAILINVPKIPSIGKTAWPMFARLSFLKFLV